MTGLKAFTLRALENHRGDDLERARTAFRGLSAEDMDKEYGRSGKTRRQIIEGYERHAAEVDAAIAWVKSLPESAR